MDERRHLYAAQVDVQPGTPKSDLVHALVGGRLVHAHYWEILAGLPHVVRRERVSATVTLLHHR